MLRFFNDVFFKDLKFNQHTDLVYFILSILFFAHKCTGEDFQIFNFFLDHLIGLRDVGDCLPR